MRALRRLVGGAVTLGVLLAIGFAVWAFARARPQDLPWTPLDLGAPVGMFTGRKLTALGEDFLKCRALLSQAGVRYTALPSVEQGQCGYTDGVRLRKEGALRLAFRPPDLGVSCPVAAALAVWEWNILQPAARKHLNSRVTGLIHFGSYSCRRMYGRSSGDFSEHATADAIDVAGFRLANGREVRVVADWQGDGPEAAFLREVRDGACDLFSTVLSPEYNAAHRDHLHLDQAERGATGWRACR